MTERAQNADFRRKPQIFADSPLLLKIQAFGGRRKPQKTAAFRRKPRRFSQKTAGNRRLGSVTLDASPLARPYLVNVREVLVNMALWVRQSSPNFAGLRKSSHEDACMLPVHPAGTCLIESHVWSSWALFCPTFLSVRNACVFVLYDLLKAD